MSTPANRTDQLVWGGFGRLAPLSLFVASILVLIAGGAAYELSARHAPTYVAYSATMLDEPIALGNAQNSGIIDKLGLLRLKYAGLVRSDDVITPAATSLGLPRGAVAGSALTSIDGGSLLLLVGAHAADPTLAVKTANALAASLRAYIVREQSLAQIQAPDKLSLLIVAPARAAAQVKPTSRQKYVSAAGAALVAFVILAATLDVIRRRQA